jgi:HAE1 family hydrophobic/amphiphilic exporter-1
VCGPPCSPIRRRVGDTSWRKIAISIPVSLIGTLGVMEVVGFSINIVSLLGLVLAVGLVVDDAIVVVET